MYNDVVKIPADTLLEIVLDIYMDDINNTIFYFVQKSNMPEHTQEDIYQESVILIMENLPKYDYKKSSVRTYIINQTKIAGLRYRTNYYKLYVPEWEINHEILYEKEYDSEEDVLRSFPLEEREIQILLDRTNGYTFTEISERHGISTRQIYNAINKFEKLYNERT